MIRHFFASQAPDEGSPAVEAHAKRRPTDCVAVPEGLPGECLASGVALSPAVSSAPCPAAPRRWRGKGRVLLVDDTEVVRRTVGHLLTALGFGVTAAEDGSRALEIYASAPAAHFALVILDLSMPGLSGLETLAGLRTLNPDVPVVLSSGHPQACLDDTTARVLPFLAKPYRLSELQEVLQGVLAEDAEDRVSAPRATA